MRYSFTILPAFAITAMLTSGCSEKQDFDASGIFEATPVTISAETAGKILWMGFHEGDTVDSGVPMAQIDTTELTLRKMQIKTQGNAIRSSTPDVSSQAASLRSQIKQAETEVRRQENLFADGATTQRNLDDAQARLRTLQAQLTGLLSTLGTSTLSADKNATAADLQAAQIEQQIFRCRITSPISGTVLIRYAEPGEYAMPGKPLYRIADMNTIYLRAYFTSSQLASLKLGEKVTVIADFGGDEQFEYPGTISWIAEESEFTPKSIQTRDSRGNLVYAVKIRVHNDGRLKLGQYGEVRLK